ncbi:H-NS histone family protein [Burkholderia gladioli]|uniref:H-NS histone family protein n=1 Tax=Burkholderia gladioli TaxID=28095 RepID=UPI00163F1432|nr:H-NS histone family protein [Burkholderia gladioli]MBU9268715.1 H-NS histone family protein [Burkholderia gladioli]MCH7275258.1 H-NS histone family protein [Burkholderia gladioli]MDN7806320.1 H-NS histone family protein [Burkholderia gladioli]
MTASESLIDKIARLERELAEAKEAEKAHRAKEKASIIEQINSLIAEHSVAAHELKFPSATRGSKAPSVKAVKGAPGIPKYRDPKTGATWTGKGKPPAWIKEVPNRDEFLINS